MSRDNVKLMSVVFHTIKQIRQLIVLMSYSIHVILTRILIPWILLIIQANWLCMLMNPWLCQMESYYDTKVTCGDLIRRVPLGIGIEFSHLHSIGKAVYSEPPYTCECKDLGHFPYKSAHNRYSLVTTLPDPLRKAKKVGCNTIEGCLYLFCRL